MSKTSPSAVTAKIEKPELRDLTRYRVQNMLILSILFSLTSGIVFRYLVVEPRKKAYKEWEKTYDDAARTKFLIEHGFVIPEEYGVP